MSTRSPLQASLRKRQHTHLPASSRPASNSRNPTLHHNRTCQAYRAAGALLDMSPSFDDPPRQPSDAEARAVATGAKLTPQQQLAKQLDLPVTLRIQSAPGRPTDRQLMSQIQAAATWNELEAVVYQQRSLPLPTTPAAAAAAAAATATAAPAVTFPQWTPLTTPAAAAGTAAEVEVSDVPGAAASKATTEPQQQQQQQQWNVDSQLPRRQPRRRQAPKPLSVEPQSAGPTQPAGSSSSMQLPAAAAAAAFRDQGLMAKPSDLLNYLHVTEAIRRLVLLLPRNPGQLAAADRARAAALVDFLTQQATAQIYNLEIDARGLAHVASSLAKLGHKDKTLISELQEAAITSITTFESQHVAMLLSALVGLRVPPNAQLLAVLQQHISDNLHLFTHQSLANTIWALAKLSTVVGIQQQQQQQQQQHAAVGLAADGNDTSAAVAAAGIDARLVKRLLYRCDPQMHLWSPVHLCQVVWGLGKLGAKGDARWCRSVLKATRRNLSKMTPQDLANIISGLPELGAVPDQEWLDAFCATAAVKMKFAEPMAVYSTLFGVAKVKQAHRKAQRIAAKQLQVCSQQKAAETAQIDSQQQQQQQQGLASPLEQQQEDVIQQPADQPGQLQQEQQQDTAISQHGQSVEHEQQQQQQDEAHQSTAPGGIPAEGIPGGNPGDTSSLTSAEVKMLCAAAMWLERLQSKLTQWQLAGVVIALSQLLPVELVQQAGALQQQQQQIEDQDRDRDRDRDEQRGARQQGVDTEQRGNGGKRKEWLSDEQYAEAKQRKLVHVLSQLIPVWREQQEQIRASLPKKRARLFKLAWGRLMQQYNAGSTEHQQ